MVINGAHKHIHTHTTFHNPTTGWVLPRTEMTNAREQLSRKIITILEVRPWSSNVQGCD